MATKKTFKIKPSENVKAEAFTVDVWPETSDEAVELWGEKALMQFVNGSSAVVQCAGKYRHFRNLKEDRLNPADAAKKMAGWKPTDGRQRLTVAEKIMREAAKVPFAERVQNFMDALGLTKDQATKAAERVGNK